jgi:hypothetical protein
MSSVRLPVWTTVKQSYGWVRHHPRLLALPMAVLFGAQFLQETLSARLLPDAWGKIGAAFLLMVVDGAFCVGLHRTIILDEVRGGFAFLRWGFEFWRYLKTILIATLAVLILGVAVLLGVGSKLSADDLHSGKLILICIILALPALYLLSRVLLAFPAAALGQDKVFFFSWRISKGNELRLLAIIGLATAIPTVMEGLLESPLSASGNETLSLLAALGSSAVEVLDAALVTAALSLTYRMLVPAPASNAETAP